MQYNKQQRFAFRKYAVGLVSVVVGCLFYGPAVLAQEQAATPPVVEQGSELVKTAESVSDDSQIAPTVVEASGQQVAKTDLKTAPANESPKLEAAESILDKSEQESKQEAQSEKAPVLEAKKTDPEVSKPEVEVKLSPAEKVNEEARVQALVRLESKKKEAPVGAVEIASRLNENQPIKDAVLKELDEKGIQYKKLADFDLIFNGFV